MTARERFLATFRDGVKGCPPRHERLIREDVAGPWQAEGVPGAGDPMVLFKLDRWDTGVIGPSLTANPALPRTITSPDQLDLWRECYQADGRLPVDWREQAARLRERDWPAGVTVGRGLFLSFGVDNGASLVDHLLFLCDHPETATAMLSHLADVISSLAEPVIEAVQPDFLYFSEPIASQHAPVVSPVTLERFMGPYYRRLVELGRAHGVELFLWESYGQVEALLPVAVAAGANVIRIGHAVGSGTDYRELRRRLGPEVGLIGGIDRRILAQDEAAIRAEIELRALPLLTGGRYAPCLDDRIRPGDSFRGFAAYRRAMEEIVGGLGR